MAVYDCFTLFNEMDLLKIRLMLLDEFVDYFVIVELTQTHRGESKKLNYKEYADEFRQYSKKIIYLTPEYIPQYRGNGDWAIENYQRNCIIQGLYRCSSEDIIMISDLDEIPDMRIFSKDVGINVKRKPDEMGRMIKSMACLMSNSKGGMMKEKLRFRKCTMDYWLDSVPVVLQQDLFYYYMNYRNVKKWYGTVVCKFKNLCMPQFFRNNMTIYPYVANAGWHFSYLGGIDKIKQKINSIVEGKDFLAKTKHDSNIDDYIKKCIMSGQDIYGRDKEQYCFYRIEPKEIGIPDIDKIIQEFPDFFIA